MIVSTTLAHSGTESTIGKAIASIAPHVDTCLLIWTGEGNPGPVEEAARAAAGHKLQVRKWHWQGDYGAGRNAALKFAEIIGADWSVTVDSDEWWQGADEISSLLSDSSKCLMAADGTGCYWQPRVIRCGIPERWSGRIHEAISISGPKLQRARFHETPKTPEQLKTKARRDLEQLRAMTRERPKEPRWHYYVGDALYVLECWEESVEAFLTCARMNGWHEESAYSCLRAGECLTSKLGRHDDAVEIFAAGMARHAGIAELAWLAGIASARAGKVGQSLYWCRLAQVHGERGVDNALALRHRVLWRIENGLRSGPAELIMAIFRDCGEPEKAAAAAAEFASWYPAA